MRAKPYDGLVYTSADDVKSSLPHITDVKLLRQTLAKLRTMKNEKTKIALIERRIHQLTGCRYRGCKNTAITRHCPYCEYRVCKEHKATRQNGNHGGLK